MTLLLVVEIRNKKAPRCLVCPLMDTRRLKQIELILIP